MNPKVEIAQAHGVLLDDIRGTALPDGQGAFWWMGQHTFIVKAAGKICIPFFDAWPSRQTLSLLTPDEARHADLVLVTHGHGDHLDPVSLQSMVTASPDARFVCPRTEASRMTGEARVPEARLHPLNAGDRWEIDGVRITAIKSKHESFDEHPSLGFPFLGYVVEAVALPSTMPATPLCTTA